MGRGRIVWGEASRKFTVQSYSPLTEVHSRDKIIKGAKSMVRLRSPSFFHLNGIFQTDVQHPPVTSLSTPALRKYSHADQIFMARSGQKEMRISQSAQCESKHFLEHVCVRGRKAGSLPARRLHLGGSAVCSGRCVLHDEFHWLSGMRRRSPKHLT